MRHDVLVDILLWILLGVAVVLLIFFFLGRRALRPGLDPTEMTFDPALMARVKSTALSGQKVQAIKELMDGTPGLGLASAKLMVDRMAAGPRPVPAATEDDQVSTSVVSLDTELAVRSLLAENQKIQAIKLVREQTGWGLKQAKDYVEGL